MFIQQLHDVDACVRINARLARVNVELEQSAHSIDFWKTDGEVQRSLAFIVDRVLIDAVQRTQHLARTRAAIIKCEMLRRPTFFSEKNDFGHETTNISKIIRQKTDLRLSFPFTVAPQAISVSTASVCPR